MPSATTYVSFLGAGRYQPARFHWGDDQANVTPYAQEAELELLLKRGAVAAAELPVLIFGTPTSRGAHWEKQRGYDPRTRAFGGPKGPGLRPRLEALGLDCTFVESPEDLSAGTQWQTFQKLLLRVERNTRLVLDMTHGFRAVPVVFSSALHFLRLTRGVILEHVLYGAHDTTPPAIIDYARFYAIQDWTDGVSRLIDDADAGKLSALSRAGTSLQIKGFEGDALTGALMSITDAVKNVDVHGVEGKVRAALGLVADSIREARAADDVASQILLELVEEKFAGLMAVPPLTGHYDAAYCELQLTFIDLLLEHRLFMQAFTAMREYIGSLGMRGYPKGKIRFTNADGRKHRSYAEVFLSMLGFPEEKWTFQGHRGEQMATLRPYYDRLSDAGIVEKLRSFIGPLTAIRNGFDHAWTGKAGVPDDIAEQGADYLERLREITAQVLALDGPEEVQ